MTDMMIKVNKAIEVGAIHMNDINSFNLSKNGREAMIFLLKKSNIVIIK